MTRRLVAGLPTGTSAWRQRVAGAAAGLQVGAAVQLDFVLPPGRWVDGDTLAENTLKGLRDGGALPARYGGLDALVATKRDGGVPGVQVTTLTPKTVEGRRAPGPAALDVTASLLPRPGRRDVKRAWRSQLAAAWRDRPPLEGSLWADVAMPVSGSLIAPLEVVLDALEPVLGRDPRGRAWQEFFPNDHLITWLRVRRGATGAALRLRIGVR